MSGEPDKTKFADQQVIDDPQAPAQTKDEQEKSQAVQEFAEVKADAGDGKQPSMRVRVYSPFKDYFDGPAFSLSAESATGPFDILPHHHNFISLLSRCEVVVRTVKGEERKFLIAGGLIHVKADNTTIFLDV